MAQGIDLWFWLIINLGLLLWAVTMLKWAAGGLLWLKDQDAAKVRHAAEEEAFNAIILAEYKRVT